MIFKIGNGEPGGGENREWSKYVRSLTMVRSRKCCNPLHPSPMFAGKYNDKENCLCVVNAVRKIYGN
jgi:hypothetical protein